MTAPALSLPEPRHRHGPSIAFPLVLITLGVAFLLANLGAFHGLTWGEVFRLWPVLLILVGAEILLRPRSYLLAAAVELAIIVVAFAYLLSGATVGPATLSYSVDVPRAAAQDLALTVNYGAGSIDLHGGGESLVSVRSTHEDVSRTVDQNNTSATVVVQSNENTVFPFDGRDRQWEITLPSDVRTGLTLNVGAGSFDMDLRDILLTRATINGGASSMTLVLPKPSGDVPIKIATGMSSLDVTIPSGVAYDIVQTGALASISGPLSSGDYGTATDRYTIRIDSAMGSVTIHH